MQWSWSIDAACSVPLSDFAAGVHWCPLVSTCGTTASTPNSELHDGTALKSKSDPTIRKHFNASNFTVIVVIKQYLDEMCSIIMQTWFWLFCEHIWEFVDKIGQNIFGVNFFGQVRGKARELMRLSTRHFHLRTRALQNYDNYCALHIAHCILHIVP